MDALVYEDTPLATYFEGEAVPYDLPREQTPPPPPFAPRGLPDLKHRLGKIRRSATSIAPGSAYNEELLEKFRYIIVASQLLSDESGPRPTLSDHEISRSDLTTLRGALLTAAASFLAAWTLNWLKSRKSTARSLTWIEVGIYFVGTVLAIAVAVLLGRRLYTNYLQRASVRTLSRYIHDTHTFENTAGNVLRFIQEVEVVARGYEVSPLPPVSRLEERQIVRRCLTLRRELATALKLLTMVIVESHETIQIHINKQDVQRYHDIYEVSLVEYSQVIDLVHKSQEEQESLKDLRFSIRLHALARKVFLCDLLALQQTSSWPRLQQWSGVLHVLQDVEFATTNQEHTLSNQLAEEEWGTHIPDRKLSHTVPQLDAEVKQQSPATKLQIRRFDDLAHSVRSLNAKIHLLREEIKGLTNTNSEDAVIACAVSKHYDSVGTELRNILSDWEMGRNSMLFQLDVDPTRTSCSSSSVRTPISPSPSLGSVQVVDGGPADALRLLNGDSPSSAHTKGIFDEEVFEAVASRPLRKRMSVSGMTREEKMAKLAEDRKKRATLQEHADNTTNMLRELQMVIKHRPKGSLGSNNTNISGHRVATL